MISLRRLLMGILVCALLVLGADITRQLLSATPYTLTDTRYSATASLTLTDDKVLFPRDCYTVSWLFEGIQAVYLNDVGTVGVGEESVCVPDAAFRVIYPNDETHTYTLTPQVLVRTPRFQIAIIAIAAIILSLYALGGAFGTYDDYRADWLTLRQSSAAHWQAFRRSGSVHLFLLAFIFITAMMLRVFVATREITFDEAYSFNRYTLTFIDAIGTYNAPNNHLLNTLFMYVLRYTTSVTAFILRMPALFAGAGTFILSYIIGRKLYNQHVGIVTAALVSGSFFLTYYAALARGYGLQTLLFLLMIALAISLVRRRNYWLWWAWVIITALAFFALPTTVYIYTGLGVWMLIETWRQARQWQALLPMIVFTSVAAMLTLLLYAPVLTRWGIASVISNRYVAGNDVTFTTFLSNLADSMPATLMQMTLPWQPLYAGMIALLILMGLWVDGRLRRDSHTPLLPLIVGVIGGVVLLQQTVPVVRVWTFLTPLILLQASLALVWGWQQITSYRQSLFIGGVLLLTLLPQSVLVSNLAPVVTDQRYQTVVDFIDDEISSPTAARFLTYNPVSESLGFYFRLQDMPLEYLSFRDYDPQKTYYLVLTDAQTPENIFQRYYGTVPASPIWEPVITEATIQVYRLDDAAFAAIAQPANDN